MNKNIKIAKKLIKLAKNLIGGRFDDTLSINAGRFDDNSIKIEMEDKEFKEFLEEGKNKIKKLLDEIIDKFKNAKNEIHGEQKDFFEISLKAKISVEVSKDSFMNLHTAYENNTSVVVFYIQILGEEYGLNIEFFDRSILKIQTNIEGITGNNKSWFIPKEKINEKYINDLIEGVKEVTCRWIQKNKENIINTIIQEVISDLSR